MAVVACTPVACKTVVLLTTSIHTIICSGITNSVTRDRRYSGREKYRVKALVIVAESRHAERLAPTPTNLTLYWAGEAGLSSLRRPRLRAPSWICTSRVAEPTSKAGERDGGERGASGDDHPGLIAGLQSPREAPALRRRWRPTSWPPRRCAAERIPSRASGGDLEEGDRAARRCLGALRAA